jgi:hypothetical protein
MLMIRDEIWVMDVGEVGLMVMDEVGIMVRMRL